VNLFEPPRTAYDWTFNFRDVPVRVSAYFWLGALLLGIDFKRGFADFFTYLLVWVVLLFVSILVHELGHIYMGRHYGSDGYVVLTHLGGLAVGSSELPERNQRIAVYLAGPGAGFVLAALAVIALFLWNVDLALHFLARLIGRDYYTAEMLIPPPLVEFGIANLLFINVMWGLVNLLPIWPLDGGQVSREICVKNRDRAGVRLSVQISLYVSLALAVVSLISFLAKRSLIPFLQLHESLFPVILFGLLAYGSYRLLQISAYLSTTGEPMEEDDQPRQPWEQDADWWKQGRSPWRD
jgi:Zn-dependent protease